MTTVGVLCARVRVEEKQVLAALAEVGLVPAPLAPAEVPLPVGPPLASEAAPSPGLIIDRCQDRAIAGAILRIARATGVPTLDAGLAATDDRLAVAAALAAAGVPRPQTRFVIGEAAAVAALADFGYPSTLLPLAPGSAPVALLDVDTAEAVLEHRSMLGGSTASLALLQAGTSAATAHWRVVVVAGRAVAATPAAGGTAVPAAGSALAESAAAAVGAGLVGIEIAAADGGLVVWDAQPVPEFRHAAPLGATSVAQEIARFAAGRSRPWQPTEPPVTIPIELDDPSWATAVNRRGEVRDGVALFA